jgi:hypothetical protein
MSSDSVAILRKLLEGQPLAVLATGREGGGTYASLVAFAAAGDLRRVVFVTGRVTTKYRNLLRDPQVSMLIDSRTHSVEDFAAAAAVTVLGRVAEIEDKPVSPLLEVFLRKHPHLESFARAPTTALCGVEVETYILVTQFQHVVELKVSECSSWNP